MVAVFLAPVRGGGRLFRPHVRGADIFIHSVGGQDNVLKGSKHLNFLYFRMF